MQRGHVLVDRPDFNKVGWVVLDGARVCGSDLAAFVALHRCQSGQDDLIGALTPGRADLEEQVTGAGLNLDSGGVGHNRAVYFR